MKYSTDVECRSDSLAVTSYRDINQFTYVNLSYVQTKICPKPYFVPSRNRGSNMKGGGAQVRSPRPPRRRPNRRDVTTLSRGAAP